MDNYAENQPCERLFSLVKSMLMKICGKCGRKIRQDEICSCQKQRHKLYDMQQRDQYKKDFYHSVAWSKVSKLAKARANGLDEYAFEYEHRIIPGSLTHHIFELNDRADLRLSPDNLIFVSTQTHAMIHAAYNRDEKSKIEMQNKLLMIRQKCR